MDLAQMAAALGLGLTIVGVLWRVGSVGRTIGERMAQLAAEMASLASRVGHLEVERRTEAAKHLEALEAEVLALRQGQPVTRVRPRKAGLL